jgi:NAD(P)-dependent dehydrogenase (short-subunit alcohol dehydrogenase family)
MSPTHRPGRHHANHEAGLDAGRVVLVTGASRGIGVAICDAFVRDGYAVTGCGRSPRTADVPADVDYRRCDVSDPKQIRSLVEEMVTRHGRIDVLVNNAAVEIEGTVEQTTPEQWDEILTVNVRAPALLAAAAIPHMRQLGGGVILNISSINAYWAEPGLPAYCASKGALTALTRAMAIDHARDNVRCLSICPGYVRTAMLEQFFDAQPDPADARRAGEQMHPLGRFAEPADIADLAVFLAGDRATFLTGHAYVADGGLTTGHV